jgi:transmembrane sensor
MTPTGMTMGEIHRMPSAEDAEREASEWLARLQADDVTAEDRARFAAWRDAHSLNAKAYEELGATWQELVQAGPLVRAVSFGQVMNAAATPPARRRRWVGLAAAAAVAAVAVLGAWNFYWQKEEAGFQTAVGEQAQVALPDGSSFDLNTNSRVWVDYSLHTRVIHLDRGEAFFKVAHDTRRPFWVRAGGSWVRAVGTAFNVYIRPSGVEVTVSEGTVKVVNAGSNEPPPTDAPVTATVASVTAGEQVNVQGRAEVIHELNSAQLGRLLAWRKSSLYFQDQPLGEVVEELARYTTLKIDIEDNALRELAVGGTFQTNPEGVEALLTMLHDGFGATIRRDEQGHVYIEGPVSQ